MGCSFFGSNCSCSEKKDSMEPMSMLAPSAGMAAMMIQAPNPDPRKFTLVTRFIQGDCVLMRIKYDGCTNYEGNKVLLFKGRREEVLHLTTIDPHFCEDCISPFARFEPTEAGWEAGIDMINMLPEGRA